MSERNGGSSLPLTGLLAAVAALIGALLWKAVPLEPARPIGGIEVAYVESSLQDIHVRLWEDPFAVISRSDAIKRAAPVRTIENVCAQLRERLGKDDKLLVLAVMVSNAPYADGEERRRRMRYAVQSAINVSHFVPENAEHLGVLSIVDLNPTAAAPVRVPFELFRRKNRSQLGFDLISMVLWLEDEAFTRVAASVSSSPTPLLRLNALKDGIRKQCSTENNAMGADTFEFKLIGPAQSSSLRAFVEEIDSPRKARLCDSCPALPSDTAIQIYSVFATASETELLKRRREASADPEAKLQPCRRKPGGREPDCSLHRFFTDGGTQFFQLTPTDDALSATLVEELERRQVSVRRADTPRHHVVLVSEWDTYYGRMLPKAFLRAAGQEQVCETDPSEVDPSAKDTSECRVLRFSYLRGLDGLGPSGGAKTSEDKEAKPTARPTAATANETADSAKQFDYLRRLAERLQNENNVLKRNDAGEIGAIGVLGSDVYDKIALLRALRPAFPRAVFFTTDLDARLLNPREQDWTRNLIVASGFGSELAPCLQKHVPPFRGSYQTGAYFATRVALFNAFPQANTFRVDHCPEAAVHAPHAADRLRSATRSLGDVVSAGPQPTLTQAVVDGWMSRPRLYEIGRTTAVELSRSHGDCASFAACTDIHAVDALHINGRNMFLLGVFAIVAVLIALSVSRTTRPFVCQPVATALLLLRQGTTPERVAVIVVTAALLATIVATVWAALSSIGDVDGERFLWAEGVSIWPSELLRLAAFVFGVGFLVWVFRNLERNRNLLEAEFKIPRGSDARSSVQRMMGRFERPKDKAADEALGALWAQYLNSGHVFPTMARALMWALVFLLIGQLLIDVFGEANRPTRGVAAFWVDVGLVAAVVVVFLMLLFCVNDAIRLCSGFIDEITRPHEGNDWSDDLQHQALAELGIGDDIDARSRLELLDPWLDLKFVARLTECVGPLLYFPFIILGLMIAARWRVFDEWDVPVSLMVVFGASFVIACVNAWLMQRAAMRARKLTLSRLYALLLRSRGPQSNLPVTPEHVDAMIKAAHAVRRGAFVPFLEQPLVRAALIPFGSAGGLYLVELFSLAAS